MFKKVLLAASPTKACERAADMAFALAKQSNAGRISNKSL
jgi:nucleotide-binding universal stress UspA family protein